MTTYNGTTGDDVFGTTVRAGDTVDGKTGDDTITLVDLSSQTGAVVYDAVAAATSAGTAPIAGMLIKNVEHLTALKTGAGDDILTISQAQGPFTWSAFSGTDRLVLNYAADTAGFTVAKNGSDYIIGGGSVVHGVELLTITGGAGDDSFDGLAGGDIIDGGAGDDTASFVFTGSANVGYNAKSAATATGLTLADGTVVKRVEHLGDLTTGSGNDTLTIAAAQGAFTWHAGSGTDTLVADYSAVTSDITAYTNAGYYYINTYNSYAYAVEKVTLTGGSGNDTLSGTASKDTLNGGTGDDVLDGLKGVSLIDGGSGSDKVALDYADLSIAINYNGIAAATATGTTLGDGSLIKNVEHLATLATGSGDDTLTLKGDATGFVWHAGDGNDRLVIDYTGYGSGLTAYHNTDYYYINVDNTFAYDIESVNVTGGSGGDTISGTDGDDSLSGGAGDDVLDGLGGVNQIDGGADDDTVSLDMHLSHSDIAFDAVAATQAAGITTADGSTIKNVEHIGELDTGSGNDTLTITSVQGVFVWRANSGNDHLIADYSAVITDIHAYAASDYFYIDTFNAYAYDVESVTVTGGSGNDTLNGTTGDDWIEGNGGDDDLDGISGNDTAVYSLATAGVHVSLANASRQDTQGAGHDLLANFDNLTGSAFGDQLTGNGSANILDGGAGADSLTGGTGDDSYYVDNAGDTTVEAAASGKDTVFATVSWTAGANIENITLLGGTASLNATGNDLDNVLTGNAGWNRLDGKAGADTMIGGLGNDTYTVDNSGDIVTELAGQGADTVSSSLNYVIVDNVENLILTGGALIGQGNDLNNTITGNTEANNLSGGLGLDVISGGEGNDVLDGGAGADTLKGGAGNDSYYVNNGEDIVTEYSLQGTDTVYSSVNYTLTANVENLYLAGAAVTGIGNALANTITGNDLANMLSGGDGADILDGGLGADTMKGGNGADSYYVDNAHDVVTEYASDTSIDQVYASVSYAMTDNVEKLTLTGSANLSGNGNAGDNTIFGNDGNNGLKGGDGNDTLIGGLGNDTLNGGTGADIMKGGDGNDIYSVDNAGDTITEFSTGGVDLVNSSISFTLGNYVENLTLTGTAAVNGSGNGLDNILVGNAGNNQLFGSSGSDTLTGGDGNDTLDGGTGIDNLKGGNGDDGYVVDNTSDVVTEYSNAGHDTVYAAISWTLGANLEDLDFSGGGNYNGTGNSLDNFITGNVGANILSGLSGNDWIDAYWGNDTYVGGTGTDTFNFSQNSGHDVISDFSLSDGDVIRVHDALDPGDNLIITQVGADVKLDFGNGNYVMVLNATDNATFESHIAYL